MPTLLPKDEWSSHQLEIKNDGRVRALVFTENGEHLVSGDHERVRVWRMQDGKEMATMATRLMNCLAVPKDGKWIAAGTYEGKVFFWDAKTYEKVFEHKESLNSIRGIDFSPDSTRFVVASGNSMASVSDIASRQKVLQLGHESCQVTAVKYSPHGDRIATASLDHVRVWDSADGRLLADVEAKVTPTLNTGLLWFHDHLFVVSENKIKRLDASTGSLLSEFPVTDVDHLSCIALPRHGEFIASSTNHSITFRNTTSHAQLAQINQTCYIRSIAFSPDDQTLAFAGEDGKIIINSPRIKFRSLPIQIEDAILDSWKLGHLVDAESSLTATSVNTNHHLLYSLSFVRTRLQQWDAAIVDAEQSIKIQPSLLGYVAKSTALAFKGEKYKAYRACDIAFDHCDLAHARFLLLVKAIIVFITGEHDDALSRVDDLIVTALWEPVYSMVQAYMYFLIGNSHMETGDYEGAIKSFEHARDKVEGYAGNPLVVISLIFGWTFDHLDITIPQRLCEALLAAGRLQEAGKSLLQMVQAVGDENHINEWVSDFTRRCLSAPHNSTLEGALLHRSTRVDASVESVTPNTILQEWAGTTLSSLSWRDGLKSSASFLVPRFAIYQAVCAHLEMVGRTIDAGECMQEMAEEITTAGTKNDQTKWTRDSRHWCCRKLEEFGDTAMRAEKHDEAVSNYSVALSIGAVLPQCLLVKRSSAYAAKKSWQDALNDANEVIRLDPSSPWGYERKCVALRGKGKQKEMLVAFKTMLLKMSQSPDPDIRARWDQYTETKKVIDKTIQVAIQDSPPVLLNTASGRLYDKTEQTAAFESSPVFTELVLSMTTDIDYSRVEKAVAGYYRYATFSHKWEPGEPLFEKVMRVVVHELERSLAHDKLRMFCQIVQEAGFNWAWSDTCCINKADPTILQEAIVAMFKWYQGSSVTIVFLRGVRSRGGLVESIWNSRAWTFQEYHASKVVRFYTEDWKPYLDPDIPNHKNSPQIISEMEEATRISARELLGLSPGLDDVRIKLFLASHRETTLIEDEAYSLLGMFSATMPVVYGEGNKSLGRLLAQLLTSSGDTSILAWTGKPSSFNSCLPARISVFRESTTTHIPPEINDAMTTLSRSLLNPTSVTKLYDRLSDLPIPLFIDRRMKLPCLTFALGPLSSSLSSSTFIFRAKAAFLGAVELRTTEDLSQLDSLTLVNPWIDFLLDRLPIGTGDLHGQSNVTVAVQETLASRLASRFAQPFGTRSQDSASLLSPLPVSRQEKRAKAVQLVSRLRQPFGALLFCRTRRNVEEYRRVAAESVIRVQIQENVSLNELMENARVLDVL